MQELESPVTTILSTAERSDLEKNRFHFDCPYMELKKGAELISGSGSIAQSFDGQLSFRLIPTQNAQNNPPFFGAQSGRLLFKEDTYALMANDLCGRNWISEWITPQFLHYWTAPDNFVVAGMCKQIQTSRKAALEKPEGLKLVLPGDIPIPVNHSDHMWVFNSNSFSFFVKREEHPLLRISLLSYRYSLAADIEERVLNALKFILASRLHLLYLEKVSKKIETVIIRSTVAITCRSTALPPIANYYDRRQPLEKLFHKYFAYMLSFPDEKSNRISIIVEWLLEASRGLLDEEALAVSVLVESLLLTEIKHNILFKEYASPSPVNEQLLSELRKHICDWEGDERLKARADGALKQFANIRALDVLIELVSKGVITQEKKKAWQDLRNGVAHGKIYSPDTKDTHELFTLVSKVTTLFYELIFLIIGYEGIYTDYASSGWPDKTFQHSLDGQ